MLSVTSVVHGIQHTVTAKFSGDVVKPTLDVGNSGQVTLTTTGGSGSVSIQLATYMPNGETAHTKPETFALHGHARIHRHTPKIKHHKRKKHKHRKHAT